MAITSASTENADIREHRSGAPGRPYLFVVLHCDRPLAGSSRHDLAELDTVLVGRGSERVARRVGEGGRRLELRFPATTVSTVHARIERGEAGWTVIDNGSKNGTFVNGERVP